MTQILYGRHPVLAALSRPAPSLEEVWLAQGVAGPWVEEVRRLTRRAGVKLTVLPREAINRLAGTPHHQGVAARRVGFAYAAEEEFRRRLQELTEPALLVAADGLTDPMNLGNLSRSALAAGAHGLIIPKDRAAGVTPAALKAAAGALEVLPVWRVTNLANTLIDLKELGLWVVGTAARAPVSLYEADLSGPLIVVIGGEHHGLRPRVRQQCDLLVSIPMASAAVDSLNAAAAGAVVLFEIRRQRLARAGR